MQYKIHELKREGGAVDGDFLSALAFPVKRVYYIYGVRKGMYRGYHAHKKLRQLIFCPRGCVRITLDDGRTREDILLDGPEKVLQIEPCLWREMEWLVDDSVLCVMASEYYDVADYIRDYGEFLRYTAENGGSCAV